MVRKADIRDIESLMGLLHQVDMVHHAIRPDLFRPDTTKYDARELEALLGDESRPVFVYDDGEVLGHAFCQVTEVRGDKLLQQHHPQCLGGKCPGAVLLRGDGTARAENDDGRNLVILPAGDRRINCN